MKKKFFAVITILIFAVIVFKLFWPDSEQTENYLFTELTKGDLNLIVTSTGILEANSTVDVGTQVSGKIAKVFVDFNDKVAKGSLLAIIDTVNLVAEVRDAEANLAKVKSEYKQKAAVHETNKILFDKKIISELDFIKSECDVESAVASLKSSESALERAKTNLCYAYIYAPISGKILDRNIEEGQTVAANFSAPTLFTIAEDLSSMRILASIDESDIGQIKEGQKVIFTVQTYIDKTFTGMVKQIRLSANTVSNVVTYTVIVSVDNNEGLLLPGMTATMDFYIEQRENVLLIANSALRIKETKAMMTEMKNNMDEDRINRPDSLRNPPGLPFGKDTNKPPMGMKDTKKVFYLDTFGKLRMGFVKTGLTDGKNTEIIMSRELHEGMKVISGIQEEEVVNNENKSPGFQTPGQQGGPPPPPMM